jgi:hypothetical protein
MAKILKSKGVTWGFPRGSQADLRALFDGQNAWF